MWYTHQAKCTKSANFYAVPPGQPLNLTLESVSYSWVAIQWQVPNDLGTYGISFYNITVYKLIPHNSTEILIMEISTEDNETYANITGLQPGMSFRIQVAGVVILRNLNIIGLGQRSASLPVNTLSSIAGNMKYRTLSNLSTNLIIYYICKLLSTLTLR